MSGWSKTTLGAGPKRGHFLHYNSHSQGRGRLLCVSDTKLSFSTSECSTQGGISLSKAIQNFLASGLAEVDVKLGGERPWDLRINNPKTYGRIARQGSLGIGETFMDGWWECDDLAEMLARALTSPKLAALAKRGTLGMRLVRLLTNPQTVKKSKEEVGRTHYVHRNRFYQLMLDPLMLYTCGYWNEKIGSAISTALSGPNLTWSPSNSASSRG